MEGACVTAHIIEKKARKGAEKCAVQMCSAPYERTL